ncbi:Altered inheritance of mitochondria 6 [Lecanosticta acicola]|uniref:Altered inheritance of mitochondria protein 6 n=1 Tax=Lecanosticta acicola TaxID=111012 RepID=A0AAI9EBI8_9PEZI|nr:Altered inheritance of mitochondria 6 [Lecanosticta acicola]
MAMAPAGGTKAAYALESRATSLSESSTLAAHSPHGSFDDDEELHNLLSRRSTRRGFLHRLLGALGMSGLRRRDHHFSPPAHDLPEGLLRKHRGRSRPSPPREVRKCRRSYAAGCIKRSLLASPLVILMAFGVLHITEVLIGRARLFWDSEALETDFLPNWGKKGQPGEGLVEYPTDATRDVIPIPCHSHNDYWRRVPLFDAIHWGCTGVEADVWLFDQELYVGHNTAALTKNRTFQHLYVNPLVDLLDKMNPDTEFGKTTGHGVFDEDPERSLVLLVDFKTGGHDTFPFLYKQLSALREKDYLTYWDGKELHSRAVTVVGTGNTPFDMIVQNTTRRDIFFDAPLDRFYEPLPPPSPHQQRSEPSDSTTTTTITTKYQSSPQGSVGTPNTTPDDFSPANSYYASVSFTHAVGFVWRGHLSPRQMEIIRGQIRGAKKRGLKVRYWDTPVWPINKRNHIWHVLMREGADMLNVDDLKGAAVESWRARMHDFWR